MKSSLLLPQGVVYAHQSYRTPSSPILLSLPSFCIVALLPRSVSKSDHLTSSRFITGYLDTQIDLTRDRPSWFPAGKSLQPPTSLLEVRHCIVHRRMPSLGELKRAAQAALDWLWEWYWGQLESAFGLPATYSVDNGDSTLENGVSDKLQSVLKTYVKARKQEIKSKRRSDLCTAASRALSTYNLRFSPTGTTLPSTSTQTALLRLLVEDDQILPADKKLGSSMSGAFLIWNPLLLSFATTSPQLFADLFKMVVQEMNRTNRKAEEREGMCEWAAHILTSADWRSARGSKEKTMREKILGDCMTELGTWNLRLAERIVESMNEKEGELWRAILDASRGETDGEAMVVDRIEQEGNKEKKLEVAVSAEQTVEPLPDVRTAQAAEHSDSSAVEKIKGPQKMVGLWKPKPIGWLPDGWDEDA